MITITIALTPDAYGNPSTITTQAHKSACPGVVITHPVYFIGDNPVFRDSWVLTHQASGWKISKDFARIQYAREAAKRLAQLELDFTQPIDTIQNNQQYLIAIRKAYNG